MLSELVSDCIRQRSLEEGGRGKDIGECVMTKAPYLSMLHGGDKACLGLEALPVHKGPAKFPQNMNLQLAIMSLMFRQTLCVNPYGAQTEFDRVKLQGVFTRRFVSKQRCVVPCAD